MILEPEYLPISVTPSNSTSDREVLDIVFAAIIALHYLKPLNVYVEWFFCIVK